MKTLMYKRAIILFAALTMLLVLIGCSKSAVENAQQSALEKQFEDNIINKNFRVHLAMDNGSDLTGQYSGYTFVLLKTTTRNGPLTATKNAVTYTGSWATNDDFSKLVISLPAAPSEFNFLTREWKFTKKSLPIMELAPWGNLEPKVLHMERY